MVQKNSIIDSIFFFFLLVLPYKGKKNLFGLTKK